MYSNEETSIFIGNFLLNRPIVSAVSTIREPTTATGSTTGPTNVCRFESVVDFHATTTEATVSAAKGI